MPSACCSSLGLIYLWFNWPRVIEVSLNRGLTAKILLLFPRLSLLLVAAAAAVAHSTTGLGRRARRAIEREAGGAGVQRSSASPLSTSDATADAASPSGVTRHSDSVGGSGGEADAPAAAPARAVPANRSLVTYDPMEIQLGNKAYKLATERDLRDAARAKVEAENQRVREADEAAR